MTRIEMTTVKYGHGYEYIRYENGDTSHCEKIGQGHNEDMICIQVQLHAYKYMHNGYILRERYIENVMQKHLEY